MLRIFAGGSKSPSEVASKARQGGPDPQNVAFLQGKEAEDGRKEM